MSVEVDNCQQRDQIFRLRACVTRNSPKEMLTAPSGGTHKQESKFLFGKPASIRPRSSKRLSLVPRYS